MTSVFLDTTIQVDRFAEDRNSERIADIDSLLRGYSWHVTCSFSRLEFKRVVIANFGLALQYLVEEGSFFSALHRTTRLRRARQHKMLVRILANAGRAANETFEVVSGDVSDLKLTMQARAYLRNAVTFLWARFNKSVDQVADNTACQRAREVPHRTKNGGFDCRIAISQCANRKCRNATFFREQLQRIRKLRHALEQMLKSGKTLSDELKDALAAMRMAEKDPMWLYDYQHCLQVGDIWIHLECVAEKVENFATTNYKESEVLCPALGLTMHHP